MFLGTPLKHATIKVEMIAVYMKTKDVYYNKSQYRKNTSNKH